MLHRIGAAYSFVGQAHRLPDGEMNWKARGLARGAPALQSSYDAENATVFAEHEGPRKLSGLTVRNANRYIDGVTLTDARDPAL